MSSIPETTVRPAFLNSGDVIARCPGEGEPGTGDPGSWTVATPPVVQGGEVWVNWRDAEGYAGVFVIPRESRVTIRDGKRAEQIAAIRDLADFLEAHPGVPVDSIEARYFPQAGDGFSTKDEQVAEVDRTAVILGVDGGPSHERDPHHSARRIFGPSVGYEAVATSVYEVKPRKKPAPAPAEDGSEANGS